MNTDVKWEASSIQRNAFVTVYLKGNLNDQIHIKIIQKEFKRLGF